MTLPNINNTRNSSSVPNSPRQDDQGQLPTGQLVRVGFSPNSPRNIPLPSTPLNIWGGQRIPIVLESQEVTPSSEEEEPLNVASSSEEDGSQSLQEALDEVQFELEEGIQESSSEEDGSQSLQEALDEIHFVLVEEIQASSDLPLEDMVKVFKGAFKIDLLKKIAVKIVKERLKLGYPVEVDDVKIYRRLIYLSLQLSLAEVLDLPIESQDSIDAQDEILPSYYLSRFGYPTITLTGFDLMYARNEVNAAMNNMDKLAAYFVENYRTSEIWENRIGETFASDKAEKIGEKVQSLSQKMEDLDDELVKEDLKLTSHEYNERAKALAAEAKKVTAEWLKNVAIELLKKFQE